MADDLVKRLRESAEEWDDCEEAHNAFQDREAADRIEELQRQLSLVNNSLKVTLSEEMTANWREFCEALIEETKEILGKQPDD